MKRTRQPPATKRHRSRQNHPTPWGFICAIENRFDMIEIDLAATKTVRKAGRFITPKQNSLRQDWTTMLDGKMGYLNPPFDPVTPWIEKCVEEAVKGARFVALLRASIDAHWFWKMAHHCTVYAISPRIKFIGSKQGYPSSLIVASFNCVAVPGPTVTNGRFKGLYRWQWIADSISREGYEQ